jgi:hypothetical protein
MALGKSPIIAKEASSLVALLIRLSELFVVLFSVRQYYFREPTRSMVYAVDGLCDPWSMQFMATTFIRILAMKFLIRKGMIIC